MFFLFQLGTNYSTHTFMWHMFCRWQITCCCWTLSLFARFVSLYASLFAIIINRVMLRRLVTCHMVTYVFMSNYRPWSKVRTRRSIVFHSFSSGPKAPFPHWLMTQFARNHIEIRQPRLLNQSARFFLLVWSYCICVCVGKHLPICPFNFIHPFVHFFQYDMRHRPINNRNGILLNVLL